MPDWPADLPLLRISARPVLPEAVGEAMKLAGLWWFALWAFGVA